MKEAIAGVGECSQLENALSSMHEDLGLIPSTA